MDTFCSEYSFFVFFLVAKFVITSFLGAIGFLNNHLVGTVVANRKNFPECYGKWAVVTGCARGIGKSYAWQLAKRGMNVVLISRSGDLLKSHAKQIEASFGVKTIVIVSDLSLGDEEFLKISKVLENLDVGVLVNNVGTREGIPNNLEKIDRKLIWNILMLNACAATFLTHHLLPNMKKRGCGLIINNSSMASRSKLPFGTMYCATKGYLTQFSDVLKYECKGTGVEVQTLCPLFINTEMAIKDVKSYPSFITLEPDSFVESALKTIGTSSLTGYWLHDIMVFLLECLPVWVMDKIIDRTCENEKKSMLAEESDRKYK